MVEPVYTKLIVPLIGYAILAPLGGIIAAPSRWTQGALFFGIVFLQCIKASTLGVMFYSIEWYRGHTKGFEFTLVDMLCISLIVASLLSRPKDFKFLPPGLIFYLFFVFVAGLTIRNTYEPLYTLMAIVNFAKASLLYVAAFNFIRSREDFRVLLHAMAAALVVECVFVLKQKYLNGAFQPTGLFDHQNSMCMWAYFYAIPLFAASLSRETKPLDAAVYLFGVACGSLAVVSALSRGSIAALVFGLVVVLILGFIFGGFTRRKITIVACGCLFGAVVIYKASDSILARFEESDDIGNPEEDFRVLLNRVSRAMLEDTGTGVGWNNFNVANSRPYTRYSSFYEEYYGGHGHSRDPRFYTANANTESLYWMYLAETGYRGFLALILFMGVTLWWVARSFWQRGERRDSLAGFFLLGLLVTLLELYTQSTIERVLTQTNNLGCWLAFLGIAAHFEQRRRIGLRARRHERFHLYWRLFREFILKGGRREMPTRARN
jgi:hypothetical protein